MHRKIFLFKSLNKPLAVRPSIYEEDQDQGFLYYEGGNLKTAILVDGGFYRKVAGSLIGSKSGSDAADKLYSYCRQHLKDGPKEERRWNELYRIFYYDCPPVSKKVYHPLTQKTVDFGKTDTYVWMTSFLKQLTQKRKVALRLGRLSETSAQFSLKADALKKLMRGERTLDSLTEDDFIFLIDQKSVDMKIGIDIASLAYKKQVDQIVLISGDSDFVPAAKLARREGIDFVLDSMGRKIRDDLFEHIDGLNTKMKKQSK